ncbi:ATP-binding cassette domain-containing protein [Microbacterium halotolerans]|uniref:ATP-binding cassette domain-containing protein n=1 Tax=Microbacterium halotolerans TaxID=246613 RepID=UPI000E6ABCE3|nr:ATP-binding cassette domain-containing protein [Microbacterium halotolerans]
MSRGTLHRISGAPIDAHVIVNRRGFRLDARVRVEHGEIVAVMGQSGAGKSTLLGAIAGVTRLSGGTVAFGNDTVATRRRHVRPQKRDVVLLGQDPRLFPHLSARDNVAFGLRVRGLDGKHARNEADEWLWQVGLGGTGDHRPRELSRGQQQRIAIARALAAAPRAVLLDEPLTSLDPETAADIRAMLQEQLISSRVAALIVTHDVTDAAALGRRLLILEKGTVTQEGPTADVLARPETPFAATVAGLNRIVGTGSSGGCLVKASEGPVRIGGSDVADAGGGPVTAAHGAPHRRALPAGYESADDAEHIDGDAPSSTRDAQAAALERTPRRHAHEGRRVTALFRPSDVRLERAEDDSWTAALRLARDAEPEPGEWLARVVRFESTPSGARVVTENPRVAAEIPAERLAGLHLAPGDPVRLSVPADRVRIIGPARKPRASGAQNPHKDGAESDTASGAAPTAGE